MNQLCAFLDEPMVAVFVGVLKKRYPASFREVDSRSNSMQSLLMQLDNDPSSRQADLLAPKVIIIKYNNFIAPYSQRALWDVHCPFLEWLLKDSHLHTIIIKRRVESTTCYTFTPEWNFYFPWQRHQIDGSFHSHCRHTGLLYCSIIDQ